MEKRTEVLKKCQRMQTHACAQVRECIHMCACAHVQKCWEVLVQGAGAHVQWLTPLLLLLLLLLQETAEHNAELMKQVLPPHVLASLSGGSRILVEKIPSACLLQVRYAHMRVHVRVVTEQRPGACMLAGGLCTRRCRCTRSAHTQSAGAGAGAHTVQEYT